MAWLDSIIVSIGSLIETYRYVALFVGSIIEGPILMVAAGFLIKTAVFAFLPALLALTLGDLTGDLFWYGVGRYAARPFIRQFGKFFSITESGLLKMEALFHKHHDGILIVSKITMGFGFALVTLMAAGASKVPLRRYLILNLLGGLIWTSFLILVGYFFGNLYYVIKEDFRIASIAVMVVVVLAVLYGFNRYMRQRFSKV